MAEEGSKQDGAKRKLDDEDNDKQSSTSNEDESATKKIKSSAPEDQQTTGVAKTNGSGECHSIHCCPCHRTENRQRNNLSCRWNISC